MSDRPHFAENDFRKASFAFLTAVRRGEFG